MGKAKAKSKSGVGQGTGKKGWNRWEKGKNKAKSFKPYTSKDNKEATNQKENSQKLNLNGSMDNKNRAGNCAIFLFPGK